MSSEDKPFFIDFELKNYELLQVFSVSGMLTVFAIEDDENEGKFKLEAEPLSLMALAKVTTRSIRRARDAPEFSPGTDLHSPDVRNEIVGVYLDGGMFEVCNEASNFAGYCKEGDDIATAIGYLCRKKFPIERCSNWVEE
jgi:hypothetical protein